MQFVPAEGCIKVELIYQKGDVIMENVLYFEVADNTMQETALELAENLVTWYDTYMKAAIPNQISLVRIDLRDAENENGYAITYTDDLPIAGTATGAELPNNVTFAVKFLTAGSGRAYRGRSFFPGITASQLDGNTVYSALASQVLAAFEELISLPMTLGSAKLSVVSKIIGGVARVAALVNNVLTIFIDGTMDSQRRRLPGRGR